jgi:hypothetical protein
MPFQAHLVMTIKGRSFTRARRVAWEKTERMRAEGHDAYMETADKPGLAPKRRRSRSAAAPLKINELLVDGQIVTRADFSVRQANEDGPILICPKFAQ